MSSYWIITTEDKLKYLYVIRETFFDGCTGDIYNVFYTEEDYKKAMKWLKEFYIRNERTIEDEWEDYFCVQDRCDVFWFTVKSWGDINEFLLTLN